MKQNKPEEYLEEKNLKRGTFYTALILLGLFVLACLIIFGLTKP